jgi:transposase
MLKLAQLNLSFWCSEIYPVEVCNASGPRSCPTAWCRGCVPEQHWLLVQFARANMLVTWAELPRSPGHVFYDKLQALLIAADFDGFVEVQCAAAYAAVRGRPSLPPERNFRMLLVGTFEGIDSERGLGCRCADSLSLREFLWLGERERAPVHSWLSRTRGRLALEVHDKVFT